MKHLMGCAISALMTGYMSEVLETVLVQGGADGPVRVNKTDFDEDQAKPSGERQYKAYTGKQEAEQSVAAGGQISLDGPPLAAPSAPDFNGPNNEAAAPVDPLKNAVAPVAHGENSRLVMKAGTGKNAKYIVVDGQGQKLDMDGIEKDGYATEEAAWTAIRALPH